MNRVPERGMRQKARILALIAESPMSDYDLADKLHICLMMVRLYVRQMRAQSRVYVSGYASQGRRIRSALYAAGDLPDAPRDPVKPKLSQYEAQMAAVIENLGQPMTAIKLAGLVNRSRKNTLIYLNDLRAQGIVHISGWSSSGQGGWSPVYKLGYGEDAPRQKYDRLERAKLFRAQAVAEKKAAISRFAASMGVVQ